MEGAHRPPIEDSAGVTAVIRRRREIFRRSMRLFAQHGYDGVSMKALTRAADLSVAGLYHYFPSKRDLGLYPLTPEFCMSSPHAAYSSNAPADHIAEWIEGALDELDETRLALEISAQLNDPTARARRASFFVMHERWLALVAKAIGLSDEAALEFARAMLAVAAGQNVTGLPVAPLMLRAQLNGVAETYLGDRSRVSVDREERPAVRSIGA